MKNDKSHIFNIVATYLLAFIACNYALRGNVFLSIVSATFLCLYTKEVLYPHKGT